MAGTDSLLFAGCDVQIDGCVVNTVRFTFDGEAFRVGLASLTEAAKRLPHIGERLVELIERGHAFDFDSLSAAGTHETVVRAKPSDRLLCLCSTSGASDADLLSLEQAFGHSSPFPIAPRQLDGETPRRDSQERGGAARSSLHSSPQATEAA